MTRFNPDIHPTVTPLPQVGNRGPSVLVGFHDNPLACRAFHAWMMTQGWDAFLGSGYAPAVEDEEEHVSVPAMVTVEVKDIL